MAMAAAGGGQLLGGGEGLACKADALWVGMPTEAGCGPGESLKATRAAVTRLRTALEGSRRVTVANRLALTQSVELGVRQDGGDADVGAGLDLAAGLVLADSVTRLAVDLRVRRLLVQSGGRVRGERGGDLGQLRPVAVHAAGLHGTLGFERDGLGEGSRLAIAGASRCIELSYQAGVLLLKPFDPALRPFALALALFELRFTRACSSGRPGGVLLATRRAHTPFIGAPVQFCAPPTSATAAFHVSPRASTPAARTDAVTIQRWVVSALVEAEPRFRRVRGYRDLRCLVAALDALVPPDGAVAAVA